MYQYFDSLHIGFYKFHVFDLARSNNSSLYSFLHYIINISVTKCFTKFDKETCACVMNSSIVYYLIYCYDSKDPDRTFCVGPGEIKVLSVPNFLCFSSSTCMYFRFLKRRKYKSETSSDCY